MEDEKAILEHFPVEGEILSVESYGSGHINHTFLIRTNGKQNYCLQEINTKIFRDVDHLMENILNVTSYLREKIMQAGGDPERETLTVIMTKEGKPCYEDEMGRKWRVYLHIRDAESLEQITEKADFYQSGIGTGKFMAMLNDYPANELYETIPDFHNMEKRFADFEEAIARDCCHRANEVAAEIAFIRARKDEMPILADMLKKGELPLRVVHNDMKLNNILVDCRTHEAVCVIDLDTVMPGLSVHDFGDAIRFGANTAAEDEPDTGRVSLSMELYDIFVEGFLTGSGGLLTDKEIAMLPMGAKMRTLEEGMRFLTDYLQGDTYFRIAHERQNLDRCRTQLALVKDMEKKWEQMCASIDNRNSL